VFEVGFADRYAYGMNSPGAVAPAANHERERSQALPLVVRRLDRFLCHGRDEEATAHGSAILDINTDTIERPS
jgi:hypothetical protein